MNSYDKCRAILRSYNPDIHCDLTNWLLNLKRMGIITHMEFINLMVCKDYNSKDDESGNDV